jgi:hypothetical protein
VQAKGIHNIANKIIAENFLNLEKEFLIHVQKASRIQTRLDQNRTFLQHIIIKTASTENRGRILKAVTEEKNNILRKIHQNNSIFLNRNLKSKKGKECGILSTEIKQFQQKDTLPSKTIIQN